jgi:hypothetical protein
MPSRILARLASQRNRIPIFLSTPTRLAGGQKGIMALISVCGGNHQESKSKNEKIVLHLLETPAT